MTGHSYVDTFYHENGQIESQAVKELPQWMQEMDSQEIEKLSRKLSRQLLLEGGRLLLDPENIRKM